jgi:hypothetical protein
MTTIAIPKPSVLTTPYRFLGLHQSQPLDLAAS